MWLIMFSLFHISYHYIHLSLQWQAPTLHVAMTESENGCGFYVPIAILNTDGHKRPYSCIARTLSPGCPQQKLNP